MKKKLPPDTHLFRESIGSVMPVKHDKVLPASKPSKARPKRLTEDHERDELAKDVIYATTDIIESETGMSFARAGVQIKQLRHLRAGKLPCQAECDLHGLTQLQAEQELENFIYECQQQGLRSIRIIHGKGRRAENPQPVLKNFVNQRLRELVAVLAFCSALPKDGGAGSVYVLLKANFLN